jgi:arsenate reductase
VLIRIGAEFFGTALLVAIVVGSGVMAETLTSDVGVSLLLNQLSTILGLGVLIAVLLPVSGAHFNPVVTVSALLIRDLQVGMGLAYILAQLSGGMSGVMLAHVMFDRAALVVSSNERLGMGTFVGEVVATSGLIALILLLSATGRASIISLAVPAWIGAAYIFTSSTSFANPAVTLGRMFTESFSGIAPLSGLGFIAAQVVGMLLALVLVRPLIASPKETSHVR